MNDKETLEEAAEKEFPLLDTQFCRTGATEEENFQLLGHRKSFIKGAKWQQERSYSEEEVAVLLETLSKVLVYQGNEYKLPQYFETEIEKVIKQFKK